MVHALGDQALEGWSGQLRQGSIQGDTQDAVFGDLRLACQAIQHDQRGNDGCKDKRDAEKAQKSIHRTSPVNGCAKRHATWEARTLTSPPRLALAAVRSSSLTRSRARPCQMAAGRVCCGRMNKTYQRPAKPPLQVQTTTLWDYPSQHYGRTVQGDAAYIGATPSYVIWNLLQRYTRPGDVVLDPMCGSGTTLDVCRDLGRQGHGFDIAPARDDVQAADARRLPLADDSVDFVFIDPPYGDHIDYSEAAGCIGKLSSIESAYFAAMHQVFAQAYRALRPRRYIGVYVCDFFAKKRGFAPLGASLFAELAEHFAPVDHICVVRHNKSLHKQAWHQAASRDNFFLRGFNHLLIAKKLG
ncbi:MAG: hypothetical protein EOO40_02425 [Deltaproteobacteria bacterium]|nr:MAG: hypothetical protein EOO40_02425 [Deltaproteobacteria bacterium]